MGSLSRIAPCKPPLPAVFVCFGEMPEVSELSSCVLWVGFSIITHLSVGGVGETNLGKRGQDWGYMSQPKDSEQKDLGKIHPFWPPVTCPENVG